MVAGRRRQAYPATVRLPRLLPKRRASANFLRSYGEDDLAGRSLLTTEDESDRIAILGAHYAFSDVAVAPRRQHGRRESTLAPSTRCPRWERPRSAPNAVPRR